MRNSEFVQCSSSAFTDLDKISEAKTEKNYGVRT